MRIQDIDYAYCRDFLSYLENVPSRWGTPLSSSSLNSYYRKFRLVLKEIVRERILLVNPTDEIKIPEAIHKERVFLTKEEIKMLINEPFEKNNLKQFFLLSCFTGLRHSDIKKLTWKDVIIENDTYFVKGIIQKTKKPFKIPLNSDALKIMGERKGDDDRVVTGLVYSGYKNNLIKQWGYKAGLKKDIHPHVGRHTFATQFTSQTKDMLSLQHIMGHKDIRTTQVYAKLVETDVQESMDKMDTLL